MYSPSEIPASPSLSPGSAAAAIADGGAGRAFAECVGGSRAATIALMHGPTFKGDGASALEGLAEYYRKQSAN